MNIKIDIIMLKVSVNIVIKYEEDRNWATLSILRRSEHGRSFDPCSTQPLRNNYNKIQTNIF